jgi:hypothetical protein
MQCPLCNQGRLFRSKRSLLEKLIYSRLGLFPWRCNACNERQMLPVRDDVQSQPDPIWTG